MDHPCLFFLATQGTLTNKNLNFYLELWLIACSDLNWLLTSGKAIFLQKKKVKTHHQELSSVLMTFYLQINVCK